MSTIWLPLRPLVVASALIVLMAGCTPGPDGTAKLDPAKSPLSEYFSSMSGASDQAGYGKTQKKVEELIAVCMAKEGFEYTPVDRSQDTSFVTEDNADRNTKKWVAENGYGLTTQTGDQPAPGPEQITSVDPNQSYVESLSATEQAAYNETLFGVSPTEAELSSGDYVYTWENGGCQGAAQHKVQPQLFDDTKFKPLLEKMNTLREEVQRDPIVAKLDASWSSCMADAGYPSYSKKQDALDTAIERLNGLYNSDTGEPAADEELKRVQTLEIDTAVADFDCSEKIDYQNKSLAVQFTLEKQFITDNKAELDSMVAEYAQAG